MRILRDLPLLLTMYVPGTEGEATRIPCRVKYCGAESSVRSDAGESTPVSIPAEVNMVAVSGE